MTVDSVDYYVAHATVQLEPWEFRTRAEKMALAKIARRMYSNDVSIQHAVNGAIIYKCEFSHPERINNGMRQVTATVMVRVPKD